MFWDSFDTDGSSFTWDRETKTFKDEKKNLPIVNVMVRMNHQGKVEFKAPSGVAVTPRLGLEPIKSYIEYFSAKIVGLYSAKKITLSNDNMWVKTQVYVDIEGCELIGLNNPVKGYVYAECKDKDDYTYCLAINNMGEGNFVITETDYSSSIKESLNTLEAIAAYLAKRAKVHPSKVKFSY